MKRCIFLCLLLALLTQNKVLSQSPLHFEYSWKVFYVNHEPSCMMNVSIINRSKEDYLLWITKDTIQDTNFDKITKNYFERKYHQYSLMELFYEIRDFSDFEIDVGYSFLKKIVPAENFTLFCCYNPKEITDPQDAIDLIMKRIAYVPKVNIDEKYGFPEYAEIGIYYPLNYILLSFDIQNGFMVNNCFDREKE